MAGEFKARLGVITPSLQSTVATGTAPFTVASTTPVANLSIGGSAATLTTSRNINGVAFNGSADITVTAAAGTLTGTTLNATVVSSSLTSVGTIGTGTWQGTQIGILYGGTGATTASTALSNLGGVPLTGGVSLTGNLYTRGAFGMRGSVSGNPLMYDVQDQSGATVLEIGRQDSVAAVTAFDMHTGATTIDYDSRLQFSGGNGTVGNGDINIFSGTLQWNSVPIVTTTGTQTLSNKTLVAPALGTPASGTVTNLTGTASININGTVGATTANTGAFTSVTSTSASGILTRAAATQDGIELIGRAGGTTSLKITLTPTTLTASRTITFPDANINFTTGLPAANGGTGLTSFTANGILYASSTSALTTGSTLSYTATGLGINQSTPAARLHIGTTALSSAAWTTSGLGLCIDAATYTSSAGLTGTVATHSIAQPTFAATTATQTVTNAATLYIANAPAAGTNVTITNPYSLYVAAGNSYFASSAAIAQTSQTITPSIQALLKLGNAGSTSFTFNSGSPATGCGFVSPDLASYNYPNLGDTAGNVFIHYLGNTTVNGNATPTTFSSGATLYIDGPSSTFSGTPYALWLANTTASGGGMTINILDGIYPAINVVTGRSYFGGSIQANSTQNYNGSSNFGKLQIYGNYSTSYGSYYADTGGGALSVAAATYTATSAFLNNASFPSSIVSFGIPTFTNSVASTIPIAANVFISGAPVAGTNTTITNSYSLYIKAGASYFGGAVSSTAAITGGYNNPAAGTTAMAFGSYNVVKVTPNATVTYTTTVPPAGTQLTLIVLTSGTTSYTITFGTGFKTTGTLATGTVAARYFMLTFVSDGTSVLETARTVAIA